MTPLYMGTHTEPEAENLGSQRNLTTTFVTLIVSDWGLGVFLTQRKPTGAASLFLHSYVIAVSRALNAHRLTWSKK